MNSEEQEISIPNELIIKFLSGNITLSESQVLDKWLHESEHNKKQFEEAKKAWMATSSLPSENEPLDTDAAWMQVKHQINPRFSASSGNFRITWYRGWAIAAVGIVMIALSSVVTWFFMEKKIDKAQNAICEISTPLGSRSHTVLPDGTEVWLNAGSRLQYPSMYKSSERDVYLTGEGYFKVRSNKQHPFVVHCADIKIKAVGTEFNVKAYPDEHKVEATLINGLVHVEGKDHNKKEFSISLIPKQKLTLVTAGFLADSLLVAQGISEKNAVRSSKKGNSFVSARPVNLTKTDLYTSWKDGQWFFEGIEIGDMAVLLERQYNVSFVFSSEELKHYTFTGTFKQETLEQVLQVLKITAPLRYEMELGKVKLTLDEALSQKYKKYMNSKISKNKPLNP